MRASKFLRVIYFTPDDSREGQRTLKNETADDVKIQIPSTQLDVAARNGFLKRLADFLKIIPERAERSLKAPGRQIERAASPGVREPSLP